MVSLASVIAVMRPTGPVPIMAMSEMGWLMIKDLRSLLYIRSYPFKSRDTILIGVCGDKELLFVIFNTHRCIIRVAEMSKVSLYLILI